MKALVLILSCCLFLFSCSKDDNLNDELYNIPKELIGKWKIAEVYETDGASEPQWKDEDTGAVYDYWFKADKSFLKGTYTVDSDLKLTLTINSSNTFKIEKLKSDTLIIDFLNFEPYKCKYIKISSESR